MTYDNDVFRHTTPLGRPYTLALLLLLSTMIPWGVFLFTALACRFSTAAVAGICAYPLIALAIETAVSYSSALKLREAPSILIPA